MSFMVVFLERVKSLNYFPVTCRKFEEPISHVLDVFKG